MKKIINKLNPMPFWKQTFCLMVIAVAVSTAATLPVILIAKCLDMLRSEIVALALLAVATVVGCIEYRAGQIGLRRQVVLEAAPALIFKVLCEAADQMSAIVPSTIEEIRCQSMDHMIKTMPVLGFELYKKNVNLMMERNTLLAYRKVLQHRIEKELTTGCFLFAPYISAGMTPALNVLSVKETPTSLLIEVAVVFDLASEACLDEYKKSMRGPVTEGKKQKPTPYLRVALDRELLKDGISRTVGWPLATAPHALYIGETGTGKSTAVKIAVKEGVYNIDGSVLLCDFKGEDFAFLKGKDGYYQGDDCTAGLERAYKLLEYRKSVENSSRNMVLFVFDEWAAYISSFGEDKEGKRMAAEAKHKMAVLLMLSRSFNIHVLISQQRGDAEFFGSARDNFGAVIALGNLSPQSRDMFFSGYKDNWSLSMRLEPGT